MLFICKNIKLCILVMHSKVDFAVDVQRIRYLAIKYDFLDLHFDKQERQHRKFISCDICYGLLNHFIYLF